MEKTSREISKKSGDMEHPPTIFLYVEHGWGCEDMSLSLYTIKLPSDISEYDQLIDSEGFMADSKLISPVLTFKERDTFLPICPSINIGSKIYFVGGSLDTRQPLLAYENRLSFKAQVFDTEHPEQGLLSVAPMHGPKVTPCLFVADGMLYALGCAIRKVAKILPGCKGTGVFERYDPISNKWLVLPDPPLPNEYWKSANLLDCATVVDRRVFIGFPIYVVFNLDTLDWDSPPPSDLAVRFPYDSLFVKESGSFYKLSGPGSWKPGSEDVQNYRFKARPLKVLKMGPLTLTKDSSLLSDPCLDIGKEQVVAQAIDLDENKRFTNYIYYPWRNLFHMGGRFFCYVVTAQLVDWNDKAHYFEPCSRGVWIKFFEEVSTHTDNNNGKTKFRTVASFCYKITTSFDNPGAFIRCSVLGTIPDSWLNAPPQKKRQESKLKHKEEGQSLTMNK